MADEEKNELLELMSKNKVEAADCGPCKKKITIEIPEESIKKCADEQYETLRKDIVVPGFRKGRAPRRLLEKRFGKETSEQIKLKLLALSSDEALKGEKIEPLRDPDIDYEDLKLPESGPFKFEFEVEVRPAFELPNLEGIAVTKTKVKVADDQIKEEVEQLQKWSGIWVTKEDGKVEAEDQILADASIKIEGVEEAEKLDSKEIFVRSQGFVGAIPVEGLDEKLAGAKAGDKKDFSVEVPKTYFREEYRGKRCDISIDVKEVKTLKPADIDKEFLGRFGVEEQADLEEKIRENLEGRAEQQQRSEMSEQIYKYLQDNTKFDLPMDIVAEQATQILQRQYVNLLRQGLSKEQVDEQTEQLKASSDVQAEEQLRTFFIMDKIAEKFEMSVTEEEINGYIANLAIQRGQRPEQLRESMAKDGSLTQFGMQIREDKCIGKMLESAKISEVEAKPAAKKSAKKPASKKAEAEPAAKTAKKTAKSTKKTVKKSEKADAKAEKTPVKAKKTAKKKTKE